ncbi:uncharacterized protein LOC109195718 isoform X2 [Oreochromis niloticus]|uniref:uncharacterized protein LOC109195718 isoform X2 n=1 Tax=Oreochromis niloticus TaxID=8128 RepID=UPI000904FA9E|nr:uncharacterized protein LOC109195718 isoform X2 [Oreochromis niloticus]
MYSYFDKNITEAIQNLDEIKEKARDAMFKTIQIFKLVSDEEKDLQVEAMNAHHRGLKCVFSVVEKNRFSWEGLLVFFLGVLQIVGGALLTVFTFGTFAQVGLGLITEGISDCITGIEALVTGEFSWNSWAIENAISIGVSLIASGIGKLISNGFKCFKTLFKFGKQLKSMSIFLSRQAKDGFSVVLKTNLKNVVKQTSKEMLKEKISYVPGKTEGKILTQTLNDTEDKGSFIIFNFTLSTLGDLIILSQLDDKKQRHDLLKDESRKNKLLAIFKEVSTAIQPFYEDLSWKNMLNPFLSTVTGKAKLHSHRKTTALLGGIQSVYMVSSHIVSIVKGQANGAIGRYIRKGLKSRKTEENLKAGQNTRHIACMPIKLNSNHKLVGHAGQNSQSYAEKFKNSTTAGTILDIRVLSEATGIKVVILTEDSNGRLTKMQELSPDTRPAKKTVTLVYRPKSVQYPDGHYDVHMNNQTMSIESKGKSCLFHALARGMKPQASEEEITVEANRLQSVEADALLGYPGQLEPFINRKELTKAMRGGEEESEPRKIINECKEVLQREVGKVELYKNWHKYAIQNPGLGKFINADHQPPVSSILKAHKQNQNSRLAEAMLEVATNSSPLNRSLISKVDSSHGRELPTVYVPTEVHREFPSTKSPAFRDLLAAAISNNVIKSTFKLTILGSMPRFWLDHNKDFKNFQNNSMSNTRLEIFENSFQKHSTEMVKTWFSLLQIKGVITDDDLKTITDWIGKSDYNDQNEPYRNEVTNLLRTKVCEV